VVVGRLLGVGGGTRQRPRWKGQQVVALLAERQGRLRVMALASGGGLPRRRGQGFAVDDE